MSKKQNGTVTGETKGQVTKKSLGGAKKLDKNDPEFQVGMLAMKTEAGRTTNHAASST
jgi:hypothetical protein